MDIDDEFEDKRSEAGGRRSSDVPTVPLRDHLETLIRGVRTELHLEITDVAAKVDVLAAEHRESSDEHGKRLHRLTGEVRGLSQLEGRRKETRTRARDWLQWFPSLLAVLIAAYVAFFA